VRQRSSQRAGFRKGPAFLLRPVRPVAADGAGGAGRRVTGWLPAVGEQRPQDRARRVWPDGRQACEEVAEVRERFDGASHIHINHIQQCICNYFGFL